MPEIKQFQVVTDGGSARIYGLGDDNRIYQWLGSNDGEWKPYPQQRSADEERAVAHQFDGKRRGNPAR